MAGRQVEHTGPVFHDCGHQLKIELEEIYFLTSFPKRGKQVSLFGTRPGGQSVASL